MRIDNFNKNRFCSNYECFELVKKKGFLGDGRNKSMLPTSTGWITWSSWIDELSKENKEINKFKEKVLPSLGRWYTSGVTTLGVGKYYDLISLAEERCVIIDRNSVSCIISVCTRISDMDQETKNSIIRMVKYAQRNGEQVDYILADKIIDYLGGRKK